MPSSHKHKSAHKHKKDDSSSESEKPSHKKVHQKLEHLAEKIEENKQKDKKVEAKLENHINHLEHKVNKEKKVDAKLECQLDKLQHKLKENEKKDLKYRLKYKTVVHRLRREKCLMINGSDAYGSFESHCMQTVKPNECIKLEKKVNALNLKLKSNSHGVKVLRDGVYMFNFTALFDQPCQITMFVNDDPELSTVTGSNNSNNLVSMHQVVKLWEGDVVSFRNYLTAVDINTTVLTSGLIPNSANVEFTLHRIAPLPEKHCLPPQLNEEAWCYSTDSESSDSSKK